MDINNTTGQDTKYQVSGGGGSPMDPHHHKEFRIEEAVSWPVLHAGSQVSYNPNVGRALDGLLLHPGQGDHRDREIPFRPADSDAERQRLSTFRSTDRLSGSVVRIPGGRALPGPVLFARAGEMLSRRPSPRDGTLTMAETQTGLPCRRPIPPHGGPLRVHGCRSGVPAKRTSRPAFDGTQDHGRPVREAGERSAPRATPRGRAAAPHADRADRPGRARARAGPQRPRPAAQRPRSRRADLLLGATVLLAGISLLVLHGGLPAARQLRAA